MKQRKNFESSFVLELPGHANTDPESSAKLHTESPYDSKATTTCEILINGHTVAKDQNIGSSPCDAHDYYLDPIGLKN
ncbi:MAG: hypothetical protein QM571_02020 [Micrococcaceae bacterium]